MQIMQAIELRDQVDEFIEDLIILVEVSLIQDPDSAPQLEIEGIFCQERDLTPTEEAFVLGNLDKETLLDKAVWQAFDNRAYAG